jgi:amino acid adenylation domain-containing protein
MGDNAKLSAAPPAFANLIDLVAHRAAISPDRIGYRFLDSHGREIEYLTYAQLDGAARSIAAALADKIRPGGRAILLYRPGLQFIPALFGCLHAGGIAIPCYPCTPSAPSSTKRRLQAVAADANPDVILTDGATLARSGGTKTVPELEAVQCVVTDELPSSAGRSAIRTPTEETIALLQYSSGSMSAPRGVMLSHRNLLANQEMIRTIFGHDNETVVVSWLPMQHDMGLIGAVLQPLYLGAPCILMSPATFLRKPLRWLEAICRYGATTSGAPDFAFETCVRRVREDERTALDLSSWKVAFNGSEPVRHRTLTAFAESFAPCGFRSSSFLPCYGLAEATLIVSGGPSGTEPLVHGRDGDGRGAAEPSVGCGAIAPGLDVRIVEPTTRDELGDGEVGEIWISGPCVAQGYWHRPQNNRATFGAALAGQADRRFLRSGDLGFVRQGHLFITGRIADVIVARGRNLHPQDLEETVTRCDPDLRDWLCVVFGAAVNGRHRLVVVHEVSPLAAARGGAIASSIQRRLATEHGITADEIVLVRPHSLPRTSSGKRQRAAARHLWQRGGLEPVHVHSSSNACTDQSGFNFADLAELTPTARATRVADHIRTRAAIQLGLDPNLLVPSRPLASYGFDSIASVEFLDKIEADFSVYLVARPHGRLPSIDALSLLVIAALAERALASSPQSPAEQDTFALSAGQRALWFETQLSSRRDLLNVVVAARLDADIEVAGIRWALQRLGEVHPSLRGRIVQHGDLLLQATAQDAISVSEVEAGSWSLHQVADDLVAQANCPFDLAGGALARVRLYHRREGEAVVLLVVHHLICDLRSVEILMTDLARLYESWSSGALVSIARPPVDYTAYVELQRSLIESQQGRRSLEYWRRQLDGCVPLALRTDRLPRPQPSHRGDRVAFGFGALRTEQIKRVARMHGTTPFSVLMSLFAILLARQAERSDVAIGTLTMGRPDGRFSRVVGHFVNPVVIRTAIDPRMSFADVLARTERTVADALDHQWIPFSTLVETLNPQRGAYRRPLCSVMFAFQQTWNQNLRGLSLFSVGQAGASVQLGSLRLYPVPVERGIAQFDLTLTIALAGDEYRGSMEYDCDLFDRGTTAALASRFVDLAGYFCQTPTRAVGVSLPMDDEERRKLLQHSVVQICMPEPECLHDRFRHWVATAPDAVALVSERGSLSYSQLHRRADGLARVLRAHGVDRGSHVAFCLFPSERVIVAILGILMTGAAYVPLDANDPPERHAFVLKDSCSKLLITETGIAHTDAGTGTRVLHYDLLEDDLVRGAVRHDAVAGSPQAPAYLIYTSGSTGTPKGMLVAHANVDRLFDATKPTFDFHRSDVWTLFHSPAFDFSVWEMWGALRHGAQLVVLPHCVTRSPPALTTWLERHGVTVLNQTPSAFSQLAHHIVSGQDIDLRLRYVILGGEPVDFVALRTWIEARGDAHPAIVTMYGITETTVHLTCRRLWRRDLDESASPIGDAIAGTRIHLLDDDLEPVPTGFAGEICVAGPGLGLGYHGRPALTAQRFVPDPHATEPGQRLYRSGDRALRRGNGELVFCGRGDTQIKVRGFRVELREIEAVLQRHPAVTRAVVLHQPVAAGRHEIVAYVVGARQPGLARILRDHAKALLAAHMLPSSFSWIDAVPLTRNGKLDLEALAALPREYPISAAQQRAAATTELERQLLALWSELLGVDQIGVDDAFFDLGGHSLLLERLATRIDALTGREVALADLYRLPTVRALARFLRDPPEAIDQTTAAGARRALDRLRRIEGQQRHRSAGSLGGLEPRR